jgi:hypothetical protein
MGAWGKEPYANDTACDFFAGAMEDGPLPEQIGKALESTYENEVRAAAFLLEKVGYGYVYPHDKRDAHIELAIRRLQEMLENETWITDWKNPEDMRAELKRQIDALRVRLDRDDENVLITRIREDRMGQPKTSVYDALAWCVQQLNNQYADHAEGDLPVEFQVARRILELRAQDP